VLRPFFLRMQLFNKPKDKLFATFFSNDRKGLWSEPKTITTDYRWGEDWQRITLIG